MHDIRELNCQLVPFEHDRRREGVYGVHGRLKVDRTSTSTYYRILGTLLYVLSPPRKTDIHQALGNKSCTKESSFGREYYRLSIYAGLAIYRVSSRGDQQDINLLKMPSIHLVFEATAVRPGCLLLPCSTSRYLPSLDGSNGSGGSIVRHTSQPMLSDQHFSQGRVRVHDNIVVRQ